MGRPHEYNFEICKEICELVANGLNIKQALAKDPKRYPVFWTWCRWRGEHDDLNDLYVRSIQAKADIVDAEIDDIHADIKRGKIDPSAGRLLIDTLKWKAAKYYPKMYGDKTQVEVSGTLKTNLPEWLNEEPAESKS